MTIYHVSIRNKRIKMFNLLIRLPAHFTENVWKIMKVLLCNVIPLQNFSEIENTKSILYKYTVRGWN